MEPRRRRGGIGGWAAALVVLALAAGLAPSLVGAAPALAATSTPTVSSAWATQTPSAPRTLGSTSMAVSCSGTVCISAGNTHDDSGRFVPTAVEWTGASWVDLHPPAPPGSDGQTIVSLSCTDAGVYCQAILCTVPGDGSCNQGGPCPDGSITCYFPQATSPQSAFPTQYLESWNGVHWSLEPMTLPPGTILYSISCSSASSCVAVGSNSVATIWDGMKWTAQTIAAPNGTVFRSVSCPLPAFCEAVGASGQTGLGPVAEAWDGTTWAAQPTPNLTGTGTYTYPMEVSCVDTVHCETTGYNTATNSLQPMAEGWDGVAWSVQSVPLIDPNQGGTISRVDCVSVALCVAIGTNTEWLQGPTDAIVEYAWDGATWSVSAFTLDPTPSTQDISCAVSCLLAAFLSVGTASEPPRTASGWSFAPLPTPTVSGPGSLQSTSCPVADLCQAVGSTGSQPLAELWDGSGWTLEAVPLPAPALDAQLNVVSCPTVAECVAVGEYSDGNGVQPFQSIWSGGVWVSQPIGLPVGNVFTSLSCAGPIECEATGSYAPTYNPSNTHTPIAAAWDGLSWDLQPLPSDPAGPYPWSLASVSCPGARDCEAVGGTDEYDAASTLALRWDGLSWTVQTTAVLPDGGGASLTGVSCTSATFCEAVGSSWDCFIEGFVGALCRVIENYDGSHWTLQPLTLPDFIDSTSELAAASSGISCTSPTFCVADTNFALALSSAGYGPVVAVWDGTAWSSQIAPFADRNQTVVLNSVSCAAAGSCVSVGQHGGGYGLYGLPLSATYTPLPPPPDPPVLTVTAGPGSLTVSITPPASSGYAPISNYEVTLADLTHPAATRTVSTTARALPFVYLNAADLYSVTAVAETAVGPGPHSAATGTVSPLPPVAPSPVNQSVVTAPGQAVLTWSKPASDGGSPISAYRVVEAAPPDYQLTVAAVMPATSTGVTLNGLTAAGKYYFVVQAVNAAGKLSTSNLVSATPTCPSSTAPQLSGASGMAAVAENGCPGYLVVNRSGQVSAYGAGRWLGDLRGAPAGFPVVGVAALPDGGGYWLLGANGQVFAFGRATFYGSPVASGHPVSAVAMAVTPDGRGYWVVTAAGGVFTYGDARFFGSLAGHALASPIVGLTSAPAGGYWIVTARGGVFTFGPEGFYGSMVGQPLATPVVGVASSGDGRGYLMAARSGGVFTFGDARFSGSLGLRPPPSPVVGIASAPGGGYYVVDSAGQVFPFGANAKAFT